jgi:hypothetical protein
MSSELSWIIATVPLIKRARRTDSDASRKSGLAGFFAAILDSFEEDEASKNEIWISRVKVSSNVLVLAATCRHKHRYRCRYRQGHSYKIRNVKLAVSS